MFCRNCGKDMGESQFCPACGTKAVDNQSAQEQVGAVKAAAVNTSVVKTHNKKTKNKKVLKWSLIISLPLILALIVTAVFINKIRHDANYSAENVANTYLQAIYKEDPNLLLKCVDKQEVNEDKARFQNSLLKEQLAKANTNYKNMYDNTWLEPSTILDINETTSDGETKYMVHVNIRNGFIDVLVKKSGKKYYIDKSNLDK